MALALSPKDPSLLMGTPAGATDANSMVNFTNRMTTSLPVPVI
jgi:hypothetical protein